MKTMNKKGQGAMEYLMTYGWAILVVLIVGIVLWQLGIFSGLGGSASTSTGFTGAKLGIIDGATYCTTTDMDVTFSNQAGGTLTDITVTPSTGYSDTALTPFDLKPGAKARTDNLTANFAYATAFSVGDKVTTDMSITYSELVAGDTITRTQAGTIICTVEA